jgi:CcmD family protein
MENFLHNNSIYLVLMIAIMIWIGIAIYIFVIDRKINKLEKDFDLINTKNNND